MKQPILKLFRATKPVYPKPGIKTVLRRLRMLWQCQQLEKDLAPVLDAPEGTAMHLLYQQRPDIIGTVIWPYICKDWDAATRLKRVASHYAVLDEIGTPFPFSIEDRLVVADLRDQFADLKLMLDQPRWFKREGGLTLNMFVADFRAYSIAFSFHTEDDGGRSIYIGGLQGRSTDEALDSYRDLTKSLFGIRPRDLLVYSLQILATHTNTKRIFAVSDECRHHRHPYFAKKELGSNYNAIWEDRAGVRVSDQFYEIPVSPYRRDIEEVKSKKRSLYKKRYSFLDELQPRIVEGMNAATLVRFVDL